MTEATAPQPWASPAAPGQLPSATATPDASPAPRPLEIRFTGSGSEYFRIWIVNLLLSIVTLSLYRPWAKARRLRYFYGNTRIDGHALDFHGDPRKMLRGYLLVGLMVLAYSVAVRFSPVAAVVAVIALAALWPALLRASLQFRLGNTSWRGLRFHFSGDLAGAYRALLPLFAPALVIVALGIGVSDPRHPPAWYTGALGAVFLVTALLVPGAWWNLKRYQHDHYGLGEWRTRLAGSGLAFYGVCLKTLGMILLSLAAMLLLVVAGGFLFGVVLRGMLPKDLDPAQGAAIATAIGTIIWLLMLLMPMPYAISRTQNLVWSSTRADALHFDSHLHFRPLLGLTVRNWLLMALTLGLYWPFAAVATYRLRMEAVTPRLTGDLDALQARAAGRADDASGDAAGDLFGIDIGL